MPGVDQEELVDIVEPESPCSDVCLDGLFVPGGFKAAAETIRHQRAQLEETQRLANVGSWEWDLLARVMVWSSELFRIFGLEPQAQPIPEEMGLSFVHPDDRRRLDAILEKTISGGGCYDTTFRIRRRDGSIRLLNTRGRATVNASGRTTGLAGTAADITDRWEAEQKLRESEARFHHLANAIPQIVWMMDAQGEFDYLNQRFFEYSGIAPDANLTTPELIRRMVHPEERERTIQDWAHMVATESDFEGELRLRAADGTYHWHLTRCLASRDESGRVDRWSGTCTDIHDRKVAAEAFRERAMHNALLADVGRALTSGQDLADELHRCCQAVVDHLGAAFARVWIVDDRKETLELKASAGMYTHLDGGHARVSMGQFKIGRIAQERQPHVTNRVVEDPRVSDREWARREGMVSFAGYPLICAGELVGVLAMFARRPLTQEDLGALASISDGIAVGVQRERAETALREKEEQIRLLLDSTAEAIVGIDPAGRCVFANRACVRLLGYGGVNDLLGRNMHELIHHTDADGRAIPAEECPLWRSAGRDGTETHLAQEVFWRADGVAFLAEVWAHPVRRDGQVIGAVVTFMDITQRAAVERELRTRVAAVEGADDEIVITNRAGIIEYVNPSFTRTTGYTYEEVIGKTPTVLKSGCHDEAFYRDLWDTILSGRVWQGEVINRRKDGTLFTEEMTITPILNEAGEVIRFVAIKRDVSERRRLEHIEREQARLQEAVQALQQVLGVVGHELRTPLAGMRAMAEMLLADHGIRLADENRFLEAMVEEVTRMSSMVNDLLEVARLNSGAARWNWDRFCLKDSCEEALGLIEQLVDRSAIALSCRVEPPDVEMQGDAAAIRRLVLNLLTNAQKNTTAGEIAVSARAVTREGASWIELSVRDTGRGIPAEIADKIGEAFALNSGVIGANYIQGSGLGLAICKGIVSAHGGSMSIASAAGVGTTVTVRLRSDLAAPCDSKCVRDVIRSAIR